MLFRKSAATSQIAKASNTVRIIVINRTTKLKWACSFIFWKYAYSS